MCPLKGKVTVSYVVLISKSCKVLDFVGISGLVFLNVCVKLSLFIKINTIHFCLGYRVSFTTANEM